MSKNLVDLIADLKEDEALQTTKELLDAGTDPMVILDHCREATELVGKRFEEGKYFIPDLLMSGPHVSFRVPTGNCIKAYVHIKIIPIKPKLTDVNPKS